MTDKQITKLIDEFKGLVEQDVVGITASDARNTITTWLREVATDKQARRFRERILEYQFSQKIQKLIKEQNE